MRHEEVMEVVFQIEVTNQQHAKVGTDDLRCIIWVPSIKNFLNY